MLSDHLRYNSVLQAGLNSTQRAARDRILQNMEDGTYQFEDPDCPTCGIRNFTKMAERDRYGIPYSLVTCNACGLYQVAPRLTPASLQDFYAHHYRKLYLGDIDATAAHSLAARERGRIALDLISFEKPLLPGSRVVEIGCAAGAQLLAFQIAGHSVAGYDYDANITSLGRQEHGLDLRVGGIDACTEDVAAGAPRVDAVLYIHVFEHLSDPREELKKIEDVLAPGGVVYLEVPGLSSCLRAREVYLDEYFEIAHTYHFDRKTLTDLIESCGWTCLWADNYVRAVLTPKRFVSGYASSTAKTIECIERARLQDADSSPDPREMLSSHILGGAKPAQAYFKVGETLFSKDDKRCLDYLAPASALDPDRGKYAFLHARALLLHAPDDATLLPVLERSVRQLPTSDSPLFHLGRALYTFDRKEEAIGAFARAIHLNPAPAIYHYWLAHAFKDIGFWGRAREGFSAAVSRDPELVFAHYYLGLCHEKFGDAALALGAFEKARSLEPRDLFVQAIDRVTPPAPSAPDQSGENQPPSVEQEPG